MKKICILVLVLFVFIHIFTACSQSLATEAALNQIESSTTKDITINFINSPSSEADFLTVNSVHKDTEEYKIDIDYPFTSYTELNKITEDLIYSYIQEYKKNLNSQHKPSLSISYDTFKHNNSIFSFKFNIHNILDNKETSTIKTLTFDLNEGKNITFDDIFEADTDYIKIISEQLPIDILAHNPILTKEKLSNFIIDKNNLTIYFEENQFENPIEFINIPLNTFYNQLSSYFKDNIEDQRKLIAITFDDGPNPLTTPILLDGLAERNVKATFFMLGTCIEKNPDIIKRMYKEGHGIGNHSYGHKKMTALNEDAAKEQYNRPNEILSSIIDTKSTLFRPPYGSFNDATKAIVDVPIILWNIDPYDWKYKDADVIANHIITRAEDGDIILLHDIYSTSVQAAFKVIDTLKEKGFSFVTVDELIRRNQIEPEVSQVFRFEKKGEY